MGGRGATSSNVGNTNTEVTANELVERWQEAIKERREQNNNRDNGTQIISWVEMVEKYDLQNTNRPHITFNKDVFIDDTIYQPRSYNISKGLEQIKQLNEAVVDVDKGIIEKRKKQLQDLGFKIESQTPYSKDDKPWSRVHLFIRKA